MPNWKWLFGDWFWWLYMVIPLYAVFKLWVSVISPMFLGRSTKQAADDINKPETTSKRQEKLRKRNERGDPRVRAQPARK
ncbi:putative protein of unknown function (DUF788) [Lyophyllum shimeji]|uniref:Uncharacterized protein n=1 Tax=Lyophyllum shimeji TaxID=47721 RepID=A0A9P3Q250_LYOSH|nr:putative protein of unknown function (DUF788) [Lyophyllum shimeji]